MKKKIIYLIILMALIVFPMLFGEFNTMILTELFILAIFSMSLDLILGFTGLVSFGHAAFLGVGAYVTGYLLSQTGCPMLLAILIGGVGSAIIAFPIGYISVRSKGLYFAMLTLAFAQLLYTLAYKLRSITGGDDGMIGIHRGSLFGLVNFDSAFAFYYLCLCCLLILFVVCLFVVRSPFGKVLVGIRENEKRVESLGYNVDGYKVLAFVLAAAIAGCAGGLYSCFMGYVGPTIMYWLMSGEAIMMVIMGGIGSLIGPIIGAGVFTLLQEVLSSFTENWMLVVGIVFAVFVILIPRGIVGVFRKA